jgi:hypothetical protein
VEQFPAPGRREMAAYCPQIAKCHIYQNVIFCPSKKPFFTANLPVEPEKRRNLGVWKNAKAFF